MTHAFRNQYNVFASMRKIEKLTFHINKKKPVNNNWLSTRQHQVLVTTMLNLVNLSTMNSCII